jgi:hypothetical protein
MRRGWLQWHAGAVPISVALVLVLAGSARGIPSGDPNIPWLERIFAVLDKAKDIHPAFETPYPVAIVDGGRIRIYEPDAARRAYVLAAEAQDKYGVPKGVRAAMPLDVWENRIACVVTPDVFGEPGGYSVILHEFVHCYQWTTSEPRLKGVLGIFRSAMERKDYMWELQYPFPYVDPAFVRDYGDMLVALDSGDGAHALAARKALKARLSAGEWEYMTWQEWKEGTARYLENELKARLGLPPNTGGLKPPFARVTFYAGGERLIRLLDSLDPGLARNIEALYLRIAS